MLGYYESDVAAALWQYAVVWAAQRMCDARLPPFGAKVLARPPPAVNLSKLGRRACPAVFLHNSPCTPGAARVAILQADGAVVCVTD